VLIKLNLILFLISWIRNLILLLLYHSLIYLYYSLICLCLLYFKLNQQLIFFWYSKFVVVFLIPLLTTMDLFGDLLLYAPMMTTLMCLVTTIVTTYLM
jgi:hypothetical protein